MQFRRTKRRVDGVLLLDKPQSWTSNAALQRVKGLFGAERAGHTGTLDPLASGLLPICLGEATKFGGELPDSDKRYQATLKLSGGKTLSGMVVNESFNDAQMRTDDGHIHLLRKLNGGLFREVTSDVDWSTYNGDIGGNRYTKLTQISKQNVKQLGARWLFNLPNTGRLQVTPVVADGVMYVTSANECYALDAGAGRQIWHFQRPRTQGLIGNAAGGVNRGVAVAGDKVFMVTDNAHLLALKKSTGEVVWETEMGDWHQNFNATSAPLVIRNLVIQRDEAVTDPSPLSPQAKSAGREEGGDSYGRGARPSA